MREVGLLVVLAVLLAGGTWLYRAGGRQARLDCAERENAALKAERAEAEKWQRIANETDEKLQKALQAPKAAPKIREVIRATPSHCNVPEPVARGLRDAIRDGNAAVSR
jgi:hypothetical protein